ncbi:MAG: hypothetical protein Q9225_007316 [Loekoesia sp. 1 TL-2023]
MQPKKVLEAAAATAAAILPKQGQSQQLFDNARADGNETIYGPLKVIDIPRFPSTFNKYPDIDPEIRKNINNGGLDPTCGSCNETGCLCPDLIHKNISFGGLCEHCRGMDGGGLRCYCSPALDGTPCHTTGPALTGCNDQPEQCNNTLPVYFCEPQNWDQNPNLTNLATPSVVYDFKKITIMPPGIGAAQTRTPQASQQTQEPQKAETSDSSKDGFEVLSAGVAVAAAAAWVYGW